MQMFQHDSATMFRFVLQGELTGDGVQELEHAWTTARSILRTKALVVEISGITKADAAGVELLSRMRETGARLSAALPPASPGFIRSMAIPRAAPVRYSSIWTLKVLRFLGEASRFVIEQLPRRQEGLLRNPGDPSDCRLEPHPKPYLE
jgi:ABC-type transporter Mla MlaB component